MNNEKSVKGKYSSFPYSRLRAFTLIELLVVIGIIVIVLAIGIRFLNHKPARLILNNLAAAIEKKLTDAQTQSSLQGVQKTLIFDKNKKLLYVSTAKPDDDNDYEVATEPPPDTPEPLSDAIIQTKSYILFPSEVKVSFPNSDEDIITYNFYPDSSAGGPDMQISMKKQDVIISVSPLTGIVFSKEVDDEKTY